MALHVNRPCAFCDREMRGTLVPPSAKMMFQSNILPEDKRVETRQGCKYATSSIKCSNVYVWSKNPPSSSFANLKSVANVLQHSQKRGQ